MKLVTIKRLQNIKWFNERAKLVNKHADLDKLVQHVTILEAPDLWEWCKGGEFVLTTWYAFSHNPELQDKNFEKLAQNISAIGIKTKRFINKIPQSIIDIADKYGVAVFEIKRDVYFREMNTVINNEIQNYTTNMLVELNGIFQEFMKKSVNENHAAAILGVLANYIKNPLLLFNKRFELLASRNGVNLNHKVIDEYVAQIKGGHYSSDMYYKGYETDNMSLFFCYVRNTVVGYLVMLPLAGDKENRTNSDVFLAHKKSLLCQQTAAFLSIKLWESYDDETKLILKLWNELKVGNLSHQKILLEKVKEYGFEKRDKYNIILFSKSIPLRKLKIYCEQYAIQHLILEEDYWNVVIIPNKAMDIFRKHLQTVFKKGKIIITPYFEKLSEIVTQYELALQTAVIVNENNINGVIDAVEWIPKLLCLRYKDSPEAVWIFKNILLPLRQYDLAYHYDLLGTLDAIFNTQTLDEAAKKLFVHINTIYYRIKKIEEITGKNLNVYTDRYLLMQAAFMNTVDKHK